MSLTCTTCSAPLRTGAPGHGRYDGVLACSEAHGKQAIAAARARTAHRSTANGSTGVHDINPTGVAPVAGRVYPAGTVYDYGPFANIDEMSSSDVLAAIVALEPNVRHLGVLHALHSTTRAMLEDVSTYRDWHEKRPGQYQWRTAITTVGRMRWWKALDAMFEAGVLDDSAELDRNIVFYGRGDAMAARKIGSSYAVGGRGDHAGVSIPPGWLVARSFYGDFIANSAGEPGRVDVNIPAGNTGYDISWTLPGDISALNVAQADSDSSPVEVMVPGNLASYVSLRELAFRNSTVYYAKGDFDGIAASEFTFHNAAIGPEFPEWIFGVSHIKKLAMRYGSINHIPKDIEKLRELEVLDLTGNPIQSIPHEIGTMQSLRELSVAETAIGVVGLASLPPALESLDVSRTPLEFINLRNCRVLKKLDAVFPMPVGADIINVPATIVSIKLHHADTKTTVSYDYMDTKSVDDTYSGIFERV